MLRDESVCLWKWTNHGVHGKVVVLRLKVYSVLVAHTDLSVALQEQLFIVTDPVEHLQREPMGYAESFTRSTHSSCCQDSSSLTLQKYEYRVWGQTNSAPFLTPRPSTSYCYCVKISLIKSSHSNLWERRSNDWKWEGSLRWSVRTVTEELFACIECVGTAVPWQLAETLGWNILVWI